MNDNQPGRPGDPDYPQQNPYEHNPFRQSQPYPEPQPHEQQPQSPVQAPPTLAAQLRKWFAPVLGGGLLLAKFGGLLKLLWVAKPVFLLLASVGVYTLFWGWKFAVGFVVLIFIHEMGHVIVLRAQGIPVSAPMFIPFIGAFVNVKGPQLSVTQEATSALAGPAIGTAAAIACAMWANLSGSLLLQALAYTAFLLNLFNLLPMLPLDGGRVAGALHPGLWFAGLVAAIGLMLWRPSPVLMLVLVLGGLELYRRWQQRRAGVVGEYYNVPGPTKLAIAAAYIATAVICLYGMHVTHLPTSGTDVVTTLASLTGPWAA